MGKVNIDINGFRALMTENINALGEFLRDERHGFEGKSERDELVELFDQVACSVNCLNTISIPGVDSFDDVSEGNQVKLLQDERF